MPASHRRGPGSIPGQSIWDLWWTKWHWDRFSPVSFIPPVFHYSEKTKKKIIAFVTGLHNKPQGCSASVAFAAGPFTTKKNLLVAIQTVCVSTPAHKGASSWFICRPVQNCKKATASFVLLVCVYVGPHGTTRLPVNRFCKHFILGIYIKICLHFPVFVKVGQK